MVDYLRKNPNNKANIPLEMLPDMPYKQTPSLFLRETLGQLADQERTIIYGLYVIGLSCHELAEMLEIPEDTVKSKAYYARKNYAMDLEETAMTDELIAELSKTYGDLGDLKNW